MDVMKLAGVLVAVGALTACGGGGGGGGSSIEGGQVLVDPINTGDGVGDEGLSCEAGTGLAQCWVDYSNCAEMTLTSAPTSNDYFILPVFKFVPASTGALAGEVEVGGFIYEDVDGIGSDVCNPVVSVAGTGNIRGNKKVSVVSLDYTSEATNSMTPSGETATSVEYDVQFITNTNQNFQVDSFYQLSGGDTTLRTSKNFSLENAVFRIEGDVENSSGENLLNLSDTEYEPFVYL